jgi:copper chaperone
MIQLNVPDISCAHCADAITRAVKAVDEAATCKVDIEGKSVQLSSKFPPTDFIEALEEVGYSSFIAQV